MAYQFGFVDRVCLKLRSKIKPLIRNYYSHRLNITDFTIISNNCWGGVVYDNLGLQKKSPTVGCYFFADDYVKFLHNLKYYLSLEIKIIDAKDSRHADALSQKNQLDIPVGVLDDVEIVFLHYKDPQIAKETWMRRCKRVNWDNMILKFSYMNGCSDAILSEFESIKGVKKICFVERDRPEYKDTVLMPFVVDGQVADDTSFWNRHFDIVGFINVKIECLDEYWSKQKRRRK